MNMKTTLQLVLTGSSGYLGQHLLYDWIESHNHGHINHDKLKIIALYHKADGFPQVVREHVQVAKKLQEGESKSSSLEVVVKSIDITDAAQVQELKRSIEHEDQDQPRGATTTVVVHTAALSSPKVCSEQPEKAEALNIPTHFFDSFQEYPLIALSTDQVYDGKQSQLYREDDADAICPVNVYGQTKLGMEHYLLRNHRHKSLVLLRSSIILGPPGPYGCGVHTTFFDFIATRQDTPTTFFTNEYRTVVSLQFVTNVIRDIMQHIINNGQEQQQIIPKVYNLGGPNRVNRYDMAKAVFDYLGYRYDDTILIKAEQTSTSVPLDISMDSTLLQQYQFGGTSYPKTISELVEYVFTSSETGAKQS
jgi:dTDP-4-dehydrorhamnose reductase